LPAGKLTLRYEEAREGRETRPGSGTKPFGGSPQLVLTIRPIDGGDSIPISPTRGTQRGAGKGRIWSKHGTVEVPAAGEYEVVAGDITETAADPPERIDPRIVLLG
jgi:hypothetical protein